MIEVIDSYYSWVKQQMATVDSTQALAGVINARDWPQTPPVMGALYLLVLMPVAIGGTESQTLYKFLCQWNWLLLGTDIGDTNQAQNRGDKYRSNMKILANLRQANFPGFCRKMAYSADSQGNISSTPVQSVYPYSSVESIWWNRPRFAPQTKQDSGLLYGVASVDVFGYEDVLVGLT